MENKNTTLSRTPDRGGEGLGLTKTVDDGDTDGGCGYQGYEFGAGAYPDSLCIDGRLYDADDCDDADHGLLYEPVEDIPCPMCRPDDAVDYWAERNQRGGRSATEARKAASSLIADIRKNREQGTEPWVSKSATKSA